MPPSFMGNLESSTGLMRSQIPKISVPIKSNCAVCASVILLFFLREEDNIATFFVDNLKLVFDGVGESLCAARCVRDINIIILERQFFGFLLHTKNVDGDARL